MKYTKNLEFCQIYRVIIFHHTILSLEKEKSSILPMSFRMSETNEKSGFSPHVIPIPSSVEGEESSFSVKIIRVFFHTLYLHNLEFHIF